MADQAYDYGEHARGGDATPVGDNVMAQLNGLASDQANAEALVTSLEERLKDAKLAARNISEKTLPAIMDELGLEKFKTTDGFEIQVKEEIRGSIPASNPEPAFKWLEDNGSEKLIKREFTIQFGKGEETWAKKFMRDLKQRKKPLNCKVKKTVHVQTLRAFIREQLEEGVAIPMETFGVFRQRLTKVKVK